MAEITYDITERIGVVSTGTDGYELQLNKISWNNRPEKYDLRPWSPDGSRMRKGITLTDDELKALKDLLNELEL